MYHSITFGEKNTWTDWHLVPSSRPVINPPKPKTQYVDIPGADGSIDLTESLAGRPVFSDREGSLDFIVLNDFNVDGYDYNWIEVYTSIMQYLHGQHMRMVLDDDPNYYYEGRFAVNSWKSDRSNSTITIDYVVGPYKHLIIPAFAASDLTIGSLEPGSNYSMPIVENNSVKNMARLDTPVVCSAGDYLRVDVQYQMDVAVYSGTVANPVSEKFVPFARLDGESVNGDTYVFTENCLYRFNVRRNTYLTDGNLTENDLSELASAMHFYTRGVL